MKTGRLAAPQRCLGTVPNDGATLNPVAKENGMVFIFAGVIQRG